MTSTLDVHKLKKTHYNVMRKSALCNPMTQVIIMQSHCKPAWCAYSNWGFGNIRTLDSGLKSTSAHMKWNCILSLTDWWVSSLYRNYIYTYLYFSNQITYQTLALSGSTPLSSRDRRLLWNSAIYHIITKCVWTCAAAEWRPRSGPKYLHKTSRD